MTGPFEGVSVLELASGIAGPYCGMLLADLGADVTKVEPPEGDPARGSPAFHVWNRGKRSVIADPQSEEGRRTIRRLASVSHIVIADFPPGQGETLGLDFEALAEENPALVYCHMPPFGDSIVAMSVDNSWQVKRCRYGGVTGLGIAAYLGKAEPNEIVTAWGKVKPNEHKPKYKYQGGTGLIEGTERRAYRWGTSRSLGPLERDMAGLEPLQRL